MKIQRVRMVSYVFICLLVALVIVGCGNSGNYVVAGTNVTTQDEPKVVSRLTIGLSDDLPAVVREFRVTAFDDDIRKAQEVPSIRANDASLEIPPSCCMIPTPQI